MNILKTVIEILVVLFLVLGGLSLLLLPFVIAMVRKALKMQRERPAEIASINRTNNNL